MRGAATLEVLSGKVKELQDSMSTLHITEDKHEVLAGLQPAGCLDQGCFRKNVMAHPALRLLPFPTCPQGHQQHFQKENHYPLSESRVTTEHHGNGEGPQVVFSVTRARRSISS